MLRGPVSRRYFVRLLASGAVAWPLAVRAQQPGMPVIGYLSGASAETTRGLLSAFHGALADTGYVEGRNVTIEYRWAENHYDRLPALAAELVRRQVAVIAVGGSTPGAHAVKAATQTIPLVFLVGPDPVAGGLVASYNRPGGNLTGVRVLTGEVIAKNFDLLHELLPAAAVIAVLVHPDNVIDTESVTRASQIAARAIGVRLLVLKASNQSEIDAAFATLIRQRADALVVSGETFFITVSDQLVALAARHGVPTIYQYRESTAAGGLMSYGPDNRDAYRILGVYTARILKGDKPADLPVQQSTKVELVINLKTAKTLGLTFPITLLGRADEVIE
jgi:putative ABC transport system substrate-binding protein